MDQYTILDIQELTHGYIGFPLHEEYIACPKCGENANESESKHAEVFE